MKVAVFKGPGQPLAIEERDIPEPEPEELLIRVSQCGICGTDLHAARPGPFQAPIDTIFGHEFVGEIVKCGSSVPSNAYKTGERITALPFIGDKTIGLGQIPGAYAEYMRVGMESVVRIPETLNDTVAALIEPLAVGLHAVKMASGVEGKNVLVIGAGPIGLVVALWCQLFGAENVVLSEHSQPRIDMAKSMGFDHVLSPAADLAAQFEEITGNPADIQFECVGATGILQECIERAPKRGLIMGVGVCDQPDTIQPLVAFAKELRIQWVVGYDKEDFEYSADMLAKGKIDASKMITDIIPLVDVPVVFDAMQQPGARCKVLIDLRL